MVGNLLLYDLIVKTLMAKDTDRLVDPFVLYDDTFDAIITDADIDRRWVDNEPFPSPALRARHSILFRN